MMDFEFDFEGRSVKARKGQSIAEALLENGVTTFRKTRHGEDRGVFCGVGVCFECRAIIDGKPNTRTCMTPVAPGCKVKIQEDARIEIENEHS